MENRSSEDLKSQVQQEQVPKEDEKPTGKEENQEKHENPDEDEDEEETERDIFVSKRLDEFYEEYFLSDFQKFAVQKFLRENVATGKESVSRVREWLFNKLKGHNRPSEINPGQKGCPEIIPGLRAQPFWDSTDLAWVKEVEALYPQIKAELIALRNEKGFQPYRGPSWTSDIVPKDGIGRKSNDSGDWNVFYLFLHNLHFEENCAKVPITFKAIEKLFPRHYHHAFFSAVTPGTHIMKHYGPTNKKLRFHMPIIGVNKSRLRAGDVTMHQEAGKCYLFDDSFEHEAWHDGDETRVVLIVDIWHPDLSIEEVKFLSLLQNARMRAEKAITEHSEGNDNFFKIIEMSKDILESNDWWALNSEETKNQYAAIINKTN